MLSTSHNKQWIFGFVVGLVVAGLLSLGLTSNTRLQKGSVAPGAFESAGMDTYCSSLNYRQCEQSTQCQVIQVGGTWQYCVRAGTSCTYTSPNAQISNLNVNPGSNASNPFDPLGSTPLSITFDVNTAATVTGAIYQGATLVKQLIAPTTYGGQVSMSWDGKDTSGQPVIQGNYEVRVSAQGATGTPADNKTAGVVVIPSRVLIYMDSGAVRPNTIDPSQGQSATLRFKLNKDAGVRITMQPVSSGTVNTRASAVVATVMNRPSVSAGEVTASWDGRKTDETFASNGTYQFFIYAGGTTGGANVTVGVQQTHIGNYYLSLDTFDPHDNEVTQIKFTPNMDVVAQVKVWESNGTTLVNDLTDGYWQMYRGGQEASVAWDGARDNSPTKVPAGTYKYTIEAIGFQRYLNSRNTYTDDDGRARPGVAGEVRLPQPGRITVAVVCQNISIARTEPFRGDSRYPNGRFRFTVTPTPSSYAGTFTWETSNSSFTLLYPYAGNTKVADVRVQRQAPSSGTLEAWSADRRCVQRVNVYTGAVDNTATAAPLPAPVVTIQPVVVTVTPAQTAQPGITLSAVSVDPSTFNPSAGQSSTIRFTSNYDINATITIKNASGATITTMGGWFAAGARTMLWNGKNSSDQIVPDGAYSVAIAASAGTLSAHAQTNVTVQTSAPQGGGSPPLLRRSQLEFQIYQAPSAAPITSSGLLPAQCENLRTMSTCTAQSTCEWVPFSFGFDFGGGSRGDGICVSKS